MKFGDYLQLWRVARRRARSEQDYFGLICLDSSSRHLPVSFVHWPPMGEFLTWHAQFLLAKPIQSQRRSGR